MRRFIACLLGVLLCSATAAAQGPAKFSGKARAEKIARFVDEQTIGIVHVDLSRLDFDQLLKHAAELAPGGERFLTPAIEHARPMAKHLVESGVKEVYLVVSLADLPQPPLFVFPLAEGANTKSLENWHGELHVEAIERLGSAVVAGGKLALERVKKQPAAGRPEIARAFEAAGDTAAQILWLPTADNRRVVEELLPTLPAEIGGGSSRVLTRGAMWASVGIDLSPRPAVRLTIQSQDAEAAAAFRDKWLAMLQLVGRDARVAKAVPQFGQLGESRECLRDTDVAPE